MDKQQYTRAQADLGPKARGGIPQKIRRLPEADLPQVIAELRAMPADQRQHHPAIR